MGIFKDRISSPLEAGPSILDVQHLPPAVKEALEYASIRLVRKGLHVTLLAVSREYQLPIVLPPSCVSPTPSSACSSPPTSPPPSRLAFATSPVAAAFRQLVRSGSALSSPAVFSDVEPSRWPQSPMSPPPMTPSTASSVMTDTTGPMPSNFFGIRLVYANDLTLKEERILRYTIEKAEKKFRIGTSWLPTALNPSSCGLTGPIIRRSIVQNEVLFSSEGLTVLSLDRLYSFKAALSSYSRNHDPMRLEDAVDELRRLVLGRAPGRLIPKADVVRSYEWLGITDAALNDVDRMYRRAYGGPDRSGAIEGVDSRLDDKMEDGVQILDDDELVVLDLADDADDDLISKAMLSFHIAPRTPPQPKVPLLKLQTNFEKPTTPKKEEEDAQTPEDWTARPSGQAAQAFPLWSAVPNSSIDEVLNEDRGPHRLGPMTPNGYEDISPITRNEWGFLMVCGDGWGAAKTAAVETCP